MLELSMNREKLNNMAKKKILFLLPYLPYKQALHAGGRFTYHWIDHLRKNNEIYSVVFLNSRDERENSLKAKLAFSKIEFASLTTAKKIFNLVLSPFLPLRSSFRCSFTFIRKLLKFRKEKFDVVVIDHSIMGMYVFVLRIIFPKALIIWNMHELYSLARSRAIKQASFFSKFFILIELWKSKMWEKLICNKCDIIFTFSSIERECINKLGVALNKIFVINPHVYELSETINFNSEREGILFFGKMNRKENYMAALYFVKKIFHLIKNQYPNAKFYIIGAEPHVSLLKLSKRREDVVVSGYVQNIKDYLKGIKVAVFPLFLGAGIRFKVLDSLIWGIPVVTSSVGIEGIPHQSDIIKVADTPQRMAQCVLDFLNKDEYDFRSLSQQAKYFIEKKYNWQENCNRIDKIIYGHAHNRS